MRETKSYTCVMFVAVCIEDFQYTCLSGLCIDARRRCDGNTDCPDGDDEDRFDCRKLSQRFASSNFSTLWYDLAVLFSLP